MPTRVRLAAAAISLHAFFVRTARADGLMAQNLPGTPPRAGIGYTSRTLYKLSSWAHCLRICRASQNSFLPNTHRGDSLTDDITNGHGQTRDEWAQRRLRGDFHSIPKYAESGTVVVSVPRLVVENGEQVTVIR